MSELEQTVTAEAKKPLIKRLLGNRQYWIDSGAAVTFSLAVGTPCELFIVGLDPWQTLKSRAMNVCLNLAFGRPYACYRDYIQQRTGIDENTGFWKKTTVDTAAFAFFWGPLYSSILLLNGADHKQTLAGLAYITVASATLGKPFGWWIDYFRSRFQRSPVTPTSLGDPC